MGARKVSNNKSDIQGHSRALTMMPFDGPHATDLSSLSDIAIFVLKRDVKLQLTD